MTEHFITLSTTEPNNNIGIVKLRHADVNSQAIVAQIVENGQSKSFEGLQPYFCLMAQETTGQGVSEESIVSFDAKKGTLTYTASDNALQFVGRNEAYFSFRKQVGDQWVEQFSTRTFHYIVEKSIYSQPFKDSNYWWTFKELNRIFNQYIEDGKKSWEEFLEANREILESIDPGGKILSELIRSRKPEGYASAYPDLPTRLDKQIGKNTDFRSFESDKSFMTRVYNESAERGLNVKWFGAVGDGVSDDTTAIQNAINSLVTSHGTVYFPRGNYKHTGITLTSGISLIGESWDNTKLINTSATNDSISIQGAGMVWPENYQISNLFITSNAISGDTRCAINNYINRNFKYDHVRISNHGIGLKEKGSWYSEHIMLDIANCDKGIFIPAYSIPGTPNSFTDCIIRECRVGLNIETGIDVFVWRGGHIGGCSEKAIFLDNTKAYNMRSISFDSTNFEGNLGIEDVVISANGTTSDNGYIHSILFTNCRFAQWSTRITGKIGVAINYGAEIISLVNCYFINYATCVVDNSSFVNGQTLLEQCGMTSSDFGFNLKGTIGNFNSINGHYRGKYFSYPAGIENIASALTIHANATLVLAEKQLDHVKIVLDVNDQIGNMQDLIVFSSNKYMRKANTAFKTGTYSVLMYPAAGYLKCQNTPALIAGTRVTLDYFIN